MPVPAGRLDPAALAAVRRRFDEIYAARYGYSAPDEPLEIVTWKLSAVGGTPRVSLAKAAETTDRDPRKGARPAYFPEHGGFVETPVYDRYALTAGTAITGPAIIEERESTTVLPPGAKAVVDAYANLIVALPVPDVNR